ncbi:hypothetical protein [Clostridium senegalense]
MLRRFKIRESVSKKKKCRRLTKEKIFIYMIYNKSYRNTKERLEYTRLKYILSVFLVSVVSMFFWYRFTNNTHIINKIIELAIITITVLGHSQENIKTTKNTTALKKLIKHIINMINQYL